VGNNLVLNELQHEAWHDYSSSYLPIPMRASSIKLSSIKRGEAWEILDWLAKGDLKKITNDFSYKKRYRNRIATLPCLLKRYRRWDINYMYRNWRGIWIYSIAISAISPHSRRCKGSNELFGKITCVVNQFSYHKTEKELQLSFQNKYTFSFSIPCWKGSVCESLE